MEQKQQCESITRQKAILALKDFPYFVLRKEIKNGYSDYNKEVIEIKQAYINYKCGAEFSTEGSAGDYLPSNVRFKIASTIINKEARFMFSQRPDVTVSSITNESDNKMVINYQTIVNKVIEKSHFPKLLIQSAKDCFIGKRVAFLVDISERDGVVIHAYNSLQFYYECECGTDRVIKFLTFEKVQNSDRKGEKLYLVNKYEDIDSYIYMSSMLYNGSGAEEQTLIEEHKVEGLGYIPAFIVINDGTLEEKRGVSEMDEISDYEATYSKLSNSDIDSERKGMNPIRYTVDMNSNTTKNLSSGAGSYWDLKSEQNQNNVHPLIGTLAPSLGHTEALKSTLDRLKMAMYNAVDMPNISEETMAGVITSGKALKALYYPLEVRCDEKMVTWIDSLKGVFKSVIDLSLLNIDLAKELYQIPDLKPIDFNINIEKNYALIEDENEEKDMDISEINANTRSRKSYLKKWRGEELNTDEKLEDELMQIAIEQNMFDSLSANIQVQTELNKKAEEQKLEDDIESIEE